LGFVESPSKLDLIEGIFCSKQNDLITMNSFLAPKLILFPGAHKTGTTLLQSALERNRRLLVKNGIQLINREEFYSSNLCRYLRKFSHKQQCEETFETAKESLMNLIGNKKNDSIVVSIENLFGEFGHGPIMYHAAEPVIGTFREALPTHGIKIVFYVRKQADFFESIYIQRVHKFFTQSFDDFYHEWHNHDMRWTPILDSISGVVGKTNLEVIPFEKIKLDKNSYILEMFEQIEKRLVKAVDLSAAKNTNRSLSQLGLEIALQKFPNLTRTKKRELLSQLQKSYGNDKFPRAKLLSDEQRQFFNNRFREDNALLAANYGCNFDSL
jgi:hypothetical protein